MTSQALLSPLNMKVGAKIQIYKVESRKTQTKKAAITLIMEIEDGCADTEALELSLKENRFW